MKHFRCQKNRSNAYLIKCLEKFEHCIIRTKIYTLYQEQKTPSLECIKKILTTQIGSHVSVQGGGELQMQIADGV